MNKKQETNTIIYIIIMSISLCYLLIGKVLTKDYEPIIITQNYTLYDESYGYSTKDEIKPQWIEPITRNQLYYIGYTPYTYIDEEINEDEVDTPIANIGYCFTHIMISFSITMLLIEKLRDKKNMPYCFIKLVVINLMGIYYFKIFFNCWFAFLKIIH